MTSFENIECENCTRECEHELKSKDSLVALPYSYQDVCKEKYSIENEQHVLRHVEANGTITTKGQRLVTENGRPITGQKFEVIINGQKASQTAQLLSVENKRSEAARKIASQRRARNIQTLWVPRVDVHADEHEPLVIELMIDGELAQKYSIEFTPELYTMAKDVPKKLAQYARRQIKQKGYNTSSNIALKADTVRFVYDLEDNEVRDVEIDLAEPTAAPIATNVFQCDAEDLDQVTGLVMALEEQIQLSAWQGADLKRANDLFHIVNKHRAQLESDSIGASITPQINAAVQEATDMLWEAVGMSLNPGVRFHQRRMEQENKPGRDFGITYAERVTQEGLDKYQELLSGKNKIKRKSLKMRLKNILEAIKRRLKSLSPGDLEDRYIALRKKLERALDYGMFDM